MLGFGPRQALTDARLERHWTQEDLARLLGTTQTNVSRWERGITTPGPYFRRKLGKLFTMREEDLGLLPQHAAVKSPVVGMLFDSTIPEHPPLPLVGRDRELAALKSRLFGGGAVALTALNGLPGVGKTALAIAIAQEQQVWEHFHDGILWAALGPQPNLLTLLSRWGGLLGVPATQAKSVDEWAYTLRSTIGTRYMLLVIDDAWNIDDALTFKVGGVNCTYLLTTRFLDLAWQFAEEGATTLHELSEDESLLLLEQLAPEALGDSEDVRALIRSVDGLPLALTLMGKYLQRQTRSHSPRRLHDALQRLHSAEERLRLPQPVSPLERLERSPSLPPGTPLSLQASIEVSDQQLDGQARQAVRALSVFPAKPNSFSEKAALAVCAAPVEVLDTLCDAGLLESKGPGRYTLHQTIADYARAHLQGTSASTRFITHIVEFVEQHKMDYEALELESDNILAAFEAAYQSERWSELVDGVCAFAPFLLVRGLYAVAELHLQRAYEAGSVLGDEDGRVRALLYLGQIAQKQGNYHQAETAFFQKGLELARQLGDPDRISALLTDLGWVTWKQGNYSQAESYLREGLALAYQLGNQERISGLLKVLGSVVAAQGDLAQSEAYLEEGLALARQIGDREQVCVLLINLGVTLMERGEYTRAESLYQEALALARQIGHREWLSLVLLNLGEVAQSQGDDGQAEVYWREGISLTRQIGHREWTSILIINLGVLANKQENYTTAEAYLKEGLELARQIGRPYITVNALYELGFLYLAQQQLEAAEAAFREMLVLAPEEGKDFFAQAQYGLARVAAARGDYAQARSLGEASQAAFASIGHRKAREVGTWLAELPPSSTQGDQ